jgi:hypothetical protein
MRDKGLYEPVLGGPHSSQKLQKLSNDSNKEITKINQENKAPESDNVVPMPKDGPKESGRPEGTGTPQTTKKVSPIGASELRFSLDKIKDNLINAQKLNLEVESQLRKLHKKRKLGKEQKEVAAQISELIIANEEPGDWGSKVGEYIKSPIDKNDKRIEQIRNISYDHQVDDYLASILYNSRIDL